jgi:serine/threonine protein kinase
MPVLTRAQQNDETITLDDRAPTSSDRSVEISVDSGDLVVTPVERLVAAPSKIPEKFGRYVLLERMGEGGMAEVFRAVIPGAEGFRRHVVLKRILASHASAPTFVEMFAQEARISALLHHPNIVQVFDFGQVDGAYFLAMELVDGWELGSVNKALRRTHAKMPIEVAAHIAHEVLLGLAYAHTLKVQGYRPNIIHRDVSPSNIMCLRAGGVKLLDFGVASAKGGLESSTQVNRRSFCGKLSYSAPEYVQGRGYDARIDLFAVGVILWEMLVGERLFRGKSDRDTMSALLGSAIPPPSSKRPAVPAELDRIVMTALERDPESRYQSAARMAEDLEQVLSDRRYQPQMLPRLLGNLFGDPAANNPSAITAVEELIQSGSTIPPATMAPAAPRLAPNTRGVLLALMSGLAALLVLLGGAALFLFLFPRASHLAGGAPVVRTVIQPTRSTPVMPTIEPIIVALPRARPVGRPAQAPPEPKALPPVTTVVERVAPRHASTAAERRRASPSAQAAKRKSSRHR